MNQSFVSTKIMSTILVAVFVVIYVGCTSSATPDAAIGSVNKTNLQRLANLYSMYQFQHQFQGPKDESEFRQFMATDTVGQVLKSMGVEAGELDKLFIGDRDGEPLQIRYAVPSGPRGSKEAVVFEKTGRGGKRMVGFLNMVQREVEAQEYETLFGAQPTAPPKNDDRMGPN